MQGDHYLTMRHTETSDLVQLLGAFAKQSTIEATQAKTGGKDARPAQTPVIQHFGQDAGLVKEGRL